MNIEPRAPHAPGPPPPTPGPRLERYRGAGGAALNAVCWRVPARRGTLVYLNGTQSHAGWFGEAAARLAAGGWEVLCADRRGSGVNREAAGFLSGHVDDYRTLIDDVRACAAELAERDGPVHLAGVSWGGKLALACAAVHPRAFAGLVLITPAVVRRRPLPLSLRLRAHLWAPVYGRRAFAFRAPVAAFTAVPARAAYIESDPLRLDQLTARFLIEDMRLTGLLGRVAPAPVPALLALADADPIIDDAAVEARLGAEFAGRIDVLRYAGAGHALALEQPERLAADIARWLEEQG